MGRHCAGAAVSSQSLRVVVADDQASVREGLVLLLGLMPEIDVVGAAANGEEALKLVAELRPDAILLDLHMPILDGIEASREIARRHPEVAIVILTTYADDDSVLAALRAGARSYLTKDADRTDIAHALRSAAAGLSVLDPGVQASLVAAIGEHPSRPDPPPPAPHELPDGLTVREGEILAMVARGMSNPSIAAALFLSGHTIKSHINRIFKKTGSTNRAEATDYARAHNLA
jgi:DNA-binding NarL/FixJ family response regulator